MNQWRSRAAFGGLLALCITAGVGHAQSEAPPPKGDKTGKAAASEGVDEEADKILRGMSDYLEKLKTFSFRGESTTEVVTDEGQKLEFEATSDVKVKRPNMLRSDRVGAFTDMSLFYDGKEIALLGRKANLYATAQAPKTLEGAVDFAREKLGLEAPAADLLVGDVYSSLTEDIVAGKVIGEEMLDGVPVDHLAFRGKEVDFQIWVEQGANPVPRKYVITSKKVEGQPEFKVRLDEWNFGPSFPASTFAFKPPEGASRIEFRGTLKDAKEKVKQSKQGSQP